MKRLIVVSGAGLSVESGIRAFRTDTASGRSMWDEYDIEEVCDLGNFQNGFRYLKNGDCHFGATDEDGLDLYTKTHNFYNMRRQELGTVEPNDAHKVIGDFYHRFPEQVVNFTTNVDDLLERTGIPREEILHVHGYLPEIRYKREKFGDEEVIVNIGYTAFNHEDFYWAKPNVVFFGESAPFYRGEIDLFDTLGKDDLVIVVGCSNQVINFNWELFPALSRGAKMVVINPDMNYLHEELYKERGVITYRTGAVAAFTDPHLQDFIEKHLEG